MSGRVLSSLQWARGFAAMAVVYFHSVLASVLSFAGQEAPLPTIGASGVDLFFVLSGFVMWTSTARKPVSTADFYRRRLVRIVPLYWTMTAVVVAVGLVVPQVLVSTKLDTAHVVASLLFIPWPNPGMIGRPMPETVAPLLVPGWTLNYEMFFYFIFGLLLHFRGDRRLAALVVALGLAMLACMVNARSSPIIAFYGSFRLLEFVAGVMVARLALQAPVWSASSPAALMAAAGAVALLLFDWTRDAVFTLTISRGLAATGVIWGLVELEKRRAIPSIPLFERLGDASYSIYLTHIFVIAALRTVAAPLLAGTGGSGQIAFVIATTMMSALVGLLVHRWYEAPLTRYLSQRWSGSARIDAAKRPAVAEN